MLFLTSCFEQEIVFEDTKCAMYMIGGIEVDRPRLRQQLVKTASTYVLSIMEQKNKQTNI